MANPGWYVCRVNAIGPIENNGVYVMLTDNGGKFKNDWIYVPPLIAAMVNETGLAAIQGSKNVYVHINPADTVGRFHLLA